MFLKGYRLEAKTAPNLVNYNMDTNGNQQLISVTLNSNKLCISDTYAYLIMAFCPKMYFTYNVVVVDKYYLLGPYTILWKCNMKPIM